MDILGYTKAGVDARLTPTDIVVGPPTGINDHIKINAAIAKALLLSAPSRIIFSPGTYVCSSLLLPMTDSSMIELVGSGSRSPSPNFRVPRRTVISYSGGGAGVFIDSRDACGFGITGLTVTHTSGSFTGTLISAGGGANHPSYSPKFKDCYLGGPTKTCTVINLSKVVECSIEDCAIVGGAVGINGGSPGYANAVTMSGGRMGDLLIAVKDPAWQWTFTGVVFEPGATVKSVNGDCEGLSFVGCGWWDGGAVPWIDIRGSGLSISGGYWEPLSDAERLVRLQGDFDGVSITGLKGHGMMAATNSLMLDLAPGASVKNLHLAGNSLTKCSDGVPEARAVGSVTFSPQRATHELRAVGNAGATRELAPAAVTALTLDQNCTLTLAAVPAGNEHRMRLHITQDATGSRLVTWPASVKWPGGVAPTLTTTPGRCDVVELSTVNGGTVWRGRVLGLNYDA